MKKWMILGVLLAGLLVLTACSSEQPKEEEPENSLTSGVENGQTGDEEQEPQAEPVPDYVVEIDVQDYGVITVELDGTAAPISVSNFVGLVNEGFYDGLTFHRAGYEFVIQGGDPNGNGTGGTASIKGEFTANGVDNPLLHTRGAISMARAQDYDSGSCQFFILHADYPSLDGLYAVFGYVTSGIEVVDAIEDDMLALGYDANMTIAPEHQPVITSIRVVD